jgi:cbb3-type cytochrome oxidase subunit 3
LEQRAISRETEKGDIMMDDSNIPRRPIDPNDDEFGAKEPLRQTQNIRREKTSDHTGILTFFVAVLAIGLVVSMVMMFRSSNEKDAAIAARNALHQELNDKAKELAAIRTIADRAANDAKIAEGVKARLQAMAIPAAVSTPVAPKGMLGVIIGTLYHKSKRAQFKDEAASALAACAKDSEKVEVCFLEVGDTTHARFETSAVAVIQTGMSQKRAGELNTCLHDKLPKLVRKDDAGNVVKGDDDKPETVKVATAVVDIGTGRYEGKGCSLE